MPLTPYHFGPGIFFGHILRKKLHFPSFLIGNIIPDIEPLIIGLINYFYGLNYNTHALFHTFTYGGLLAIFLGLIIYRIDKKLTKYWQIFGIYNKEYYNKKFNQKNIILSMLLGVYLHIFLDALYHENMNPFAPFINFNPLLLGGTFFISFFLHCLCIVLILLGIYLHYFKNKEEIKEFENIKITL